MPTAHPARDCEPLSALPDYQPPTTAAAVAPHCPPAHRVKNCRICVCFVPWEMQTRDTVGVCRLIREAAMYGEPLRIAEQELDLLPACCGEFERLIPGIPRVQQFADHLQLKKHALEQRRHAQQERLEAYHLRNEKRVVVWTILIGLLTLVLVGKELGVLPHAPAAPLAHAAPAAPATIAARLAPVAQSCLLGRQHAGLRAAAGGPAH